jgi:hypothetical protein
MNEWSWGLLLHNYKVLVWTLCLMHRCVFDGTYYKITTTNYISKTSLYTTFRMYPSRPWPLKILMFSLLVTRELATYSWPWEKTEEGKYMLSLLLILVSKSWGCPPPRPGHAFPRQQHMRRVSYLFLPGFSSLYDTIHGWMTGWMDGWMESFMKNDHHFLYYM